MANKNIPKKYMLILQKRYGGQEAVEFLQTGDAYTVPVKAFTDEKYQSRTKKDSKVQKNTLAFYDAITNKFKSFDQFLAVVGKNIYPFDYKADTSYIGFLNKGFMHTVSLSFNDPTLAHIALSADGNNINKKDKTTINIVTDIVDMIEDSSCDFVARLKNAYDMDDKRFNFSRSFIDNVITYHSAKKAMDARNKYSHIMSDEMTEDLEIFKRDFLDKMQSYKNFRELYRFRRQYLYDKKMAEHISVVSPVEKKEEKEPVDNFEAFRAHYEEVRQKEYPRQKQKTKSDQIPGQLSLFDLPKTR